MGNWRRHLHDHVCDFDTDVFSEFVMGDLRRRWLKIVCMYNFNSRINIRSSAALDFEKKRQILSEWWYIIHPFSLFRMVWEPIMIVILFLAEIECAFFMTWRQNLYFNCSTDILKLIHILNIIVTFMTGYVDPTNEQIVLHQGKIAIHYLRSHLILDLIAAFPWTSLIVEYVITESTLKTNHVLLIFSFTAMFTLVFGKERYQYTKNVISYFSIEMKYIRIYRLITSVIFIFHWLTCIECNIVFDFAGSNQTNLIKAHGDHNLTKSEMYWKCLFRTASLVTHLNYNYSEEPSDLLPDFLCIIVGSIFVYYVLEELLLLNMYISNPASKYRIEFELLNDYMRHKEMPDAMQERIRSYYEYRYQKMIFLENNIFSNLSPRLRLDITMHTCRHLVRESLLFRNVPRSAMTHIVKCLKHDIFLPHDVIIKAGSFADSMFFLTCGTVAVITRTGIEIAHLKDGSYFGELALLMNDERRVTSIIAIEFCEVYRLERADFKKVIPSNSQLHAEIERVALERLHQTLTVEGMHRELLAKEHSKKMNI